MDYCIATQSPGGGRILNYGACKQNMLSNYTMVCQMCNISAVSRSLQMDERLGYGMLMTRDEIRKRLAHARVGIAGLGGLGSNCAAALARSGIGSLVLVDFDIVSEGNLDRQFYFRDQVGMPKARALADNLSRIDPSVRLETHIEKLDADLVIKRFHDCGIIVEAFDQADAKKMIIETVLEHMPDTWIVAASGLAGFGEFESIRKIRSGRLILCGDGKSEVGPDAPPLAPRVGIVACMEADAVLEILLGSEDAFVSRTIQGGRQ